MLHSVQNFVKIANQLDQDALPTFCDTGVFTIFVDIYLQRKDKLQILIQMLGGLHAAKCNGHWLEKYLDLESGIEGSLQQTKAFGMNVADTVLNGINYKRSFKDYFILANAIEKWDASLKIIGIN